MNEILYCFAIVVFSPYRTCVEPLSGGWWAVGRKNVVLLMLGGSLVLYFSVSLYIKS